MNREPRPLLLSPHCDDIAYSLAGQILAGDLLVSAETGAPPHLLTLFSQSTFAPYAPGSVDRRRITALRLAEDGAFCQALGLTHDWLPLAEAPLRGYPDVDSLFVEAEQASRDPVLEELTRRLASQAERSPPTRVYAPLGIGGHVDHLVTRLAAQRVFDGHCPLYFYEDLPYAGELAPGEREGALASCARGLRPWLTPLGDWLREKVALLMGYRSQVAEKDIQSVVTHAFHIGGERVWSGS